MGFPVSRRKVDRLGERLIGDEEISEDDYRLLEEVLTCYGVALGEVQDKLRREGMHAVGRLKNTGTLQEKLRRVPSLKLSRIQDVGGLRIVLDGRRSTQDSAVTRLQSIFAANCGDPIDRRLDPRSGYRAVHLVVTEDGLPIEIQVRTSLQDAWAQTYERFGDMWGREIRYGGEPRLPDEPMAPGVTMTRREAVAQLRAVSDVIDKLEEGMRAVDVIEATLELHGTDLEDDAVHALRSDRDDMIEGAEMFEAGIRSFFEAFVELAGQGADLS